MTINGTAVVLTFVTSIGTTPGNVLIGASAAATCGNLIALLSQPQTTTSTGVALSAANQTLVGYLSWPLSGTTLTPSSNNTSLYAPQTTFTASTTATGGSYTAQTLQLYVEPGVVYVSGTRVIYGGGSTPTVTPPSTNPRIDVLAIDNAGALSWTTGSENASPVAPTYPANKIALCELYNMVGETALYDFSNQHTSQGYVLNDVRPIIGMVLNLLAVTSNIIPDADGTRDIGSSGTRWNNGYFKNNVFVNGNPIASARFGGTGADGALSVTSGTTTVTGITNGYLEKNYSSISVTGTGVLAFAFGSAQSLPRTTDERMVSGLRYDDWISSFFQISASMKRIMRSVGLGSLIWKLPPVIPRWSHKHRPMPLKGRPFLKLPITNQSLI